MDNIKLGNQNIKKLKFFLSNFQKINESGTLGLKIQPIDKELKKVNDTGLINQLKKDNIISSYNFYFKFDKNNKFGEFKGKLIIGILPHENEPKIFNIKQLKNTKISDNIVNTTWKIHIKKCDYGIDLFYEESYGIISSTFGLIYAPIILKNKFFDKFFYKNRDYCYEEFNGEFYYFYCDDNVNITEFKNLFFLTVDKEINFTLTSQDLFYKKDKKYYFLILFKDNLYIWEFGLIFLQKFTFVFNTDKKTIGYYYSNFNEENENSNFFIYGLLIIFALIIIILIIYIYYLLPLRKRKIRANELDDEFDYTSKII